MSHQIHATSTPKCDAAIAAAGYDFEQSLIRMQAYEAASQEYSPSRCPECHHFLSCNHARTCSRQTDDQLRQAVASLLKDAERDARHIRDAHLQRLAWYGKWMAVKQENNALRKANRALRVALANLQIDKEYAKVECVTRCAYQLPDCHCPRCTGRPPEPPFEDEGEPQMSQPPDLISQFFAYEHLPPHLQAVSKPFGDLAKQITETLPSNPERTTALRKLLEAKDCAVRALLFKFPLPAMLRVRA